MLTILAHGAGGSCTVYMPEHLNTSNAEQVQSELLPLVEQYSDITLDMTNLIYVSSAGLRVLKRMHTLCENQLVTLLLANVHESAMEIFHTTGFSDFFHFI